MQATVTEKYFLEERFANFIFLMHSIVYQFLRKYTKCHLFSDLLSCSYDYSFRQI